MQPFDLVATSALVMSMTIIGIAVWKEMTRTPPVPARARTRNAHRASRFTR